MGVRVQGTRASATSAGATGLVCNDAAFRRVRDLNVLVLDEMLK